MASSKETPELLSELNSLLDYDPETGIFVWKKTLSIRAMAGSIAGSSAKNGYRKTSIRGREHYLHRLAWAMSHGAWPIGQIDHVNGVRSDNRICNLREASPSQNVMNSKTRRDNLSGVKGVYWVACRNKWSCRITRDGNTVFLGYFHTIEDARIARDQAAAIYHGAFSRSA